MGNSTAALWMCWDIRFQLCYGQVCVDFRLSREEEKFKDCAVEAVQLKRFSMLCTARMSAYFSVDTALPSAILLSLAMLWL
jgi:hypothetical protein